MCVFLCVGGPTWAPQTFGIAWSARNWLGGKGKGIRQKLPLLSKTRDFHITKRGNLEPQFEFQGQKLHEGYHWKENEEHKGRNEVEACGPLIYLTYNSFFTHIYHFTLILPPSHFITFPHISSHNFGQTSLQTPKISSWQPIILSWQLINSLTHIINQNPLH